MWLQQLKTLSGKGLVVIFLLSLSVARAQEPKKPPTAPKAEKKASPSPTSRLATPKKTTTTPKPKTVVKPTRTSARATPRVKPSPERSSRTSGKKSEGQAAVAKETASSSKRKASRTFPYDPYGLAAASFRHFDLQTFLITPEAEARYRIDSLSRRAAALMDLLEKVSDELLQRGLRSRHAARALYVLSIAQKQPVWLQPQLHTPQLIAVKSAFRAQAREAATAADVYETLRTTANALFDKLSRESTNDPASLDEQTSSSVTVSVIDYVTLSNRSLLYTSAPTAEEFELMTMANRLVSISTGRKTLASFAPPPPVPDITYSPLIPPDTPMPEPGEARRKYEPSMPMLKAPSTLGLLFPAMADSNVMAPESGTVVFAGPLRGYGNIVVMEVKNSTYVTFAFLERILVREEETVKAGATIGTAGHVRPHGQTGVLIFVRLGETDISPADFLKSAPFPKIASKDR